MIQNKQHNANPQIEKLRLSLTSFFPPGPSLKLGWNYLYQPGFETWLKQVSGSEGKEQVSLTTLHSHCSGKAAIFSMWVKNRQKLKISKHHIEVLILHNREATQEFQSWITRQILAHCQLWTHYRPSHSSSTARGPWCLTGISYIQATSGSGIEEFVNAK